MITELRKSINSILYQRVSSPLFGTLILSWVVWNWKIIYLTFFINAKEIKQNKIDYIVEKLSDTEFLIWYPLISAFILLTIIPFVSNGSYWLSLKFEKWKKDQKKSIEKYESLTSEQSTDLREEILDSEKKFNSLLQSKSDEIKQLKLLLEKYQTSNNIVEIFNIIKQDEDLKMAISILQADIQKGSPVIWEKLSTTGLSFFQSRNLIELNKNGELGWTKKGDELNRRMSKTTSFDGELAPE
jgi:hypothetical protein